MKKTQSTNLLDDLAIASPCSMSWDKMIGDNRARNCSGCNKTVYNISDMTTAEAESFLRENSTTECFKFKRRFDGTIVTDDCPRALRVVRDRCKLAVKIAFGMIAFVISLPAAFTQSLHNQSPMLAVPGRRPICPYVTRFRASEVVDLSAQQVRADFMGNRVIMRPSPVLPEGSGGKPAKATASVSATIITKEHQTPRGKVILVDVGEKEKVVQFEQTKCSESPQTPNKLVDKRAADFYYDAHNAIASKDLKLAESYFLKALDAHDQQSNADPAFRKRVANELEKLRAQERTATEAERVQKEKQQ